MMKILSLPVLLCQMNKEASNSHCLDHLVLQFFPFPIFAPARLKHKWIIEMDIPVNQFLNEKWFQE